MASRAGADVDQTVRRADRRLVVFDDHDRVAGPPQIVDALDQPVVIGRVQSDRRLIQHVTDADQPAADVGRQPDALQFAAGERFGSPVQRQVIDAHADQITQPPRDLGRDRCGDSRLQRRQFPRQGFTPRRRLVDRHRDQFRDGPPADRHRPRLRPQPRAVACGADGRTTAGRLPPVGGEPDQSDPVARPARPVRAVVTERPRLDLLERLAAIHARHCRRKNFFTRFAVRGFDHRGQQPVGHFERRVDRRGQPRPAAVVLDLQPVHDGVDRMQFPDGQRRHVLDRRHHPVDADPDQTRRDDVLQHLAVTASAAADDRRQDRQLRADRQRRQFVDDRRRVPPRHLAAAPAAVQHPDPCVQQPQIVVHLGDRRDGAASAGGVVLLVDRQRRSQPVDRVDVRPRDLVQELSSVRRQRIDVLPLTLGVQRVERQRRFPAARHAGNDRQRVPRDVDIDIPQVVDADPPQLDRMRFGRRHGLPDPNFCASIVPGWFTCTFAPMGSRGGMGIMIARQTVPGSPPPRQPTRQDTPRPAPHPPPACPFTSPPPPCPRRRRRSTANT